MRAMVALARNKSKGSMSLSQIAQTEHISQAYLERLFARLRADDLVKSAKGVTGGYRLSRSAKKISIFEIVEALEGPLAVFYCISDKKNEITCTPGRCLTKKVWSELQKNMVRTLRKFTLADLT